MSKKSGVFDVQSDIRDSVFTIESDTNRKVSITIEKALVTIIRQMQVSGLRPRTISDYNLHMTHFRKITKMEYVDDITPESIYE